MSVNFRSRVDHCTHTKHKIRKLRDEKLVTVKHEVIDEDLPPLDCG